MTKMLKHFTPLEDSSSSSWKATNAVTLKCELITKTRPPKPEEWQPICSRCALAAGACFMWLTA
jgi:hypothetical protein